jgi:hypothetical protein
MPNFLSSKILLTILGAVAVLTVVLSVVTGTFAGIFVVVVVAIGALPLRRPTLITGSKPLLRALLCVLGAALAVVSSLIDHSYTSGAVVLLFVVLVAWAWRTIIAAIAPGEPLPSALASVLQSSGVTLAEESVAGWTSGVTTSGAVVLLRVIKGHAGAVDEWPGMAKLKASAGTAARALEAQGITPRLVAVAEGSSGVYQVMPWITICSPNKISSAIRELTPSITDARALAAEAGVTLGREAARRVERMQRAPKTKSSGRPEHHGRVTPKKPS